MSKPHGLGPIRPSQRSINLSIGWRPWAVPLAVIAGLAPAVVVAGWAASEQPESEVRSAPALPAVAVTPPSAAPQAAVPLAAPEQMPEAVVESVDSEPVAPSVVPDQPETNPARIVTIPTHGPIKRAAVRTEAQITADLANCPEIGLQTFGVDIATFSRSGTAHPALALFDSRPDLGRLPLRRGDDCQLSRPAGRRLFQGSIRLRRALGMLGCSYACDARGRYVPPPIATVAWAAEEWPTLVVWMLQAEGEPARTLLIDLLGRASVPAATQALVGRALFDPSPALRLRAANLLKGRPPADARAILLAALQYPWPAAADHAANALVALGDTDAVPDLVRLLDGPDPAGPCPGPDGSTVRRDVVRINHSHSCQLCHAPSTDSTDQLRTPVPSPYRQLPPSFETRGMGNYYSHKPSVPASPGTEYVRADVTYLRPDFSMLLPVEYPGPWPKMQRYDFVVRTRLLRPGENVPASESYPQREAVLRALRALTHQDFGDRSADWRAGLAVDVAKR
jgi:hypothetical protein